MIKQCFRPKSFVYVFCVILINLFLVGAVYLTISGILNLDMIYILSGLTGLLISIVGDIKLFRNKITILEDSIYISPNYFQSKLNKSNLFTEIKFKDIEKFEVITNPVQVISIKTQNFKKPLLIYVKQFSKKQVNLITNLLNQKIAKSKQ